jgi:hypothetical protein
MSFRREDVLRLWPGESKGSASPTTAAAKSVPTAEPTAGEGAPAPRPQPRKAAPKGDKIEQALKARGFHLDRQGKTYKEIANIIKDEVGAAFGTEPAAREKAVWRALKRLKQGD